MFCKYCGTKATTTGFCTSCGQALPLPATAPTATAPTATTPPAQTPQQPTPTAPAVFSPPQAPPPQQAPPQQAPPAQQTPPVYAQPSPPAATTPPPVAPATTPVATPTPAPQPTVHPVTHAATAAASTQTRPQTPPQTTTRSAQSGHRDPRKRAGGLRVLAIVGAAVLVLAGAGGAVWWLIGGGDDEASDTAALSYGSNAEWDALWDSCEAGSLSACDDLYNQAPVGSDYRNFGATCGNGEGRPGACAEGVTGDTASGTGFGSDPELDLLWGECEEGSMFACDDLFFSSPPGSEYEEYGATCGGRGLGDGDCVSQFP